MYDSERMTKYIQNPNAQQHAIFQEHHMQTQAKFKKTMPSETKEKVKVQLAKAQAKFKKTMSPEKKEKGKVQLAMAQAVVKGAAAQAGAALAETAQAEAPASGC